MNILKIKELASSKRKHAERILDGDADGYDGADGARTVLQLCDMIDVLVALIEQKPS